MQCRSGEPDKTYFRSERFQLVNQQWYFATREMTLEGPYDSKKDAEMELLLYLRHANEDMFSNLQ